MTPFHVLIVTRDAHVRERLGSVLRRQGASMAWADKGSSCLSTLDRTPCQVLFADMETEGVDDDLVRQAVSIQPGLSVVVLADRPVLDLARLRVRVPHTEFVAVPFSDGEIHGCLQRAIHRGARPAADPRAAAPGEPAPDAPDDWAEIFAQFAADRPAMSEIIDLVARVAPTDAAVLIEGEIGTGKALLAYHLHSRSRRSGGPFVRVPCDSLGETDADETLFGRPGHNGDGKEPVAPGFLRSALGGTLFLENVCHLPFATQVKLFDALQGDDRDRPALPEARRGDVRVVASTREDLKAAVAENRFYSGLYYLLNVVPVRVPALRQRPQDVRLLAERFLAAVSRTWNPDRPPPRFNDQAWECLLGYDWPGNAAQLAGAVARAAVLSNGPEIGPECLPDLPPPGSPARRNGDTVSLPLAGGLKAMERSIIEEMVHRCRGNKAAAARALGLHRRTLYRMLDEGVSPLDSAPQAGAPAPTHLPAIVPAAPSPAAVD
jgi:DNA-binding NtrC family response regulator